MAKTIAIALQKGGTGKTTLVSTLASIWGANGKKVLCVDMDSQANLTYISGIEQAKTIVDVLAEDSTIQDAVVHCDHYDLLSGDARLSHLESVEDIDLSTIKDQLAEVTNDYDFILLDTPPALGNLLRMSLYAADFVLVPVDAKPLAIKGLDALIPTIHEVDGLEILGLCLMRYNSRSVVNRELREVLAERAKNYGTILFDATIRDTVTVVESQTECKTLIDYAPKAKVTEDFNSLADEILKRLER